MSGKVSVAMADLLRRLAKHRQVFCVTHQAVVAAAADQHLLVQKEVQNGVTRTLVRPLLNPQDREKELAELPVVTVVRPDALLPAFCSKGSPERGAFA